MNLINRVAGAAVSVAPAPEAIGAAASAAGAAASAATTAASAATSAAATASTHAAGMAKDAKSYAIEQAGASKEKLQQLVQEMKTRMNQMIKQKVYQTTERVVVDRLPGLAKSMLEDPEAPSCISKGKDKAVDIIWPDVKEEIMWTLAVQLNGQSPEEELAALPSGSCCLLAFLRYHMFPYDKGFWGKLRDPVHVIIMLISIIPFWGVSPMFFFFIFLVIDRSDTYQLLSYILQFKGTQFISVGILRVIQGYVAYLLCVTAPAEESDHRCDDAGPGSEGAFLLTTCGFVFQMFMSWIAFMLLPCSTEQGRQTLSDGETLKAPTRGNNRGGALIYFLFYDLIMFAICGAALGYVLTTVDKYDHWVMSHSIFALQTLYGFSSMPFFIFTLPGIQLILTHAQPTAYDRSGRIRRPAKAKAAEERRDVEKKASSPISWVSEADISSVVEPMKSILPQAMQDSIFTSPKQASD
eukprot:TRINITY_DN24121_c0_g1_i2.p1 TRINITY_DN24121_c0_g1~~TRINITY_DN24121_c0_g1_i2.p1  ORF type:complete len:468 (-),score=97.22 TRINITY_DN24121_c0_g1_i2:197-1600(-)